MKFNPTFLEILVFLVVSLFIFIWTKHGRRIRRWLQDYFADDVARVPSSLNRLTIAHCVPEIFVFCRTDPTHWSLLLFAVPIKH